MHDQLVYFVVSMWLYINGISPVPQAFLCNNLGSQPFFRSIVWQLGTIEQDEIEYENVWNIMGWAHVKDSSRQMIGESFGFIRVFKPKLFKQAEQFSKHAFPEAKEEDGRQIDASQKPPPYVISGFAPWGFGHSMTIEIGAIMRMPAIPSRIFYGQGSDLWFRVLVRGALCFMCQHRCLRICVLVSLGFFWRHPAIAPKGLPEAGFFRRWASPGHATFAVYAGSLFDFGTCVAAARSATAFELCFAKAAKREDQRRPQMFSEGMCFQKDVLIWGSSIRNQGEQARCKIIVCFRVAKSS